jgi:tetratricopeptide (TPR) repeat protein
LSHAAAALFLLGSALDSAGLSLRYARMVALYASGGREAAVSQVGELSSDDLRRELKALRKVLGPGAPTCRLCEREISLRAALMLHTDRALFEKQHTRQADGEPECVASLEADVAAAIAEILAYRDLDLRDFAARWAAATALRARADGCMLDAVHYVDLGLRWSPHDPTLLLVRGTIHETIASALVGLAEPRPEEGPGSGLRYRDELGLALASFEGALAVDPGAAEARLRLGRVQWRLGRAAQARASLHALLQAKPNSSLAYLAHLFLGRLDEDADRFDDAQRQYRVALELDPSAQAAGVGLSHALLLGGDDVGAREALKAALDAAPRSEGDMYWGYPVGGGDFAQSLFEQLRRESSE